MSKLPRLGMIKDDDHLHIEYASDFTRKRLKRLDKSLFSLEELSRQLDRGCEDRNNHSMIKTHEVLAVLLYRTIGREEALKVMWEIARNGGLDAMSGLRNNTGFELAYPEFFEYGLSNDDWKLPD
jgi:hypothetical protein